MRPQVLLRERAHRPRTDLMASGGVGPHAVGARDREPSPFEVIPLVPSRVAPGPASLRRGSGREGGACRREHEHTDGEEQPAPHGRDFDDAGVAPSYIDVMELDGLGYRGATAVVVGCSSGIGAATLRILGELGAQVHAVSVNEPEVPHATFHRTDLSQLDEIEATVKALETIGPIDHLIVASGIPVTRGALDILRVNYVGVRRIVEGLVPLMREGGAIGVVSSSAAGAWEESLPLLLEIVAITDSEEVMAWFAAHPDLVADGYRLSKQLLSAWVAHVAPTLASDRHLRINCTAPGVTETALIEETRAYVPEGFFERYPHPLFGRGASAEEQAWTLVLLNSALNACVTGSTLFADQGVSAGTRTGSLAPHH